MRATRLRVEYLKNPIGIDITKPRLSWNCEGDKKQSAYRIVAMNDSSEILWDSKKVISSQMVHIPWDSTDLSSRAIVNWKVCLWDVAGENEFFIAPKPGGSFAHAKAEYNSVYGKVVSGWVKAEDGTYQFEVEVPANTTAKVNLPDGRKMFCEAGTYQF